MFGEKAVGSDPNTVPTLRQASSSQKGSARSSGRLEALRKRLGHAVQDNPGDCFIFGEKCGLFGEKSSMTSVI
jgi:hypothetical protein